MKINCLACLENFADLDFYDYFFDTRRMSRHSSSVEKYAEKNATDKNNLEKHAKKLPA